MSSWAVALRVARRDARRAKGRSALVLAMIALPVLGVTAVDVLARTAQLDAEQTAARELGAADVAARDTGLDRLEQFPDGGFSTYGDGQGREGEVDPLTALPPGSRAVVDRTGRGARVGHGEVVVQADRRELAYDDPVAAGIYLPRSGRAPRAAGEVALTTSLAGRLGVRVNDRVELDGAPVEVVGTVASAASRGAQTVLLPPGAVPPTRGDRVLVDLAAPLTWDVVRAANAQGVVLELRDGPAVPGAPDQDDQAVAPGTDALAVIGLVVGMALLEVVLLAGPAFAVGAKRQERVLALMSVTGAERRDVRRTVLAGGVVLGVVAGLLGATGGVAAAAAGLPLLGRYVDAPPGPFEVRALEVGAIALLGALTAVAAALLPALQAARTPVLAGLTGRRGVRRGSYRVPLAGVIVTLAGAAVAWQGAHQRGVTTILAGAALAELGLVATTPAVVGLAGRLGPLLPAGPRLALRDAARNRYRTAPAVAAVLAAVAGSVAVGTYVASLDADDRAKHLAVAAQGTGLVLLGEDAAADVPRVTDTVQRLLPGAAVLPVVTAESDERYVDVAVPPEQECPELASERRHPDPRCGRYGWAGSFNGGLVVGGPEVLPAMYDGPVDGSVLGRGGALVPAYALWPDGTAHLRVQEFTTSAPQPPRVVVVPGQALPADGRQAPLLSPAAAEAAGIAYGVSGLSVTSGGGLSDRQEDRLRAAVQAVVPRADVSVERGYVSNYGLGLLALLVGSAVLVLGASGIATGLAAADGRADLSTLAAVGASPGLRRRLAGAQSVVTAGLGTVLGTVAGLVPAIGLIRAINAPDVDGYQRPVPFPTVVPWGSIAITLLVVPLLAGLLAALVTRSRLPLVRRVA